MLELCKQNHHPGLLLAQAFCRQSGGAGCCWPHTPDECTEQNKSAL